tara:strand:- start:14434 stop:14826 length:393 start_codon:yes stop_codon:yes gene_type:complete
MSKEDEYKRDLTIQEQLASSRVYCEEVQASAKYIRGVAGDYSDDYEDGLSEATWEYVDGHRWIIYYWGNEVIMTHTRNYDAVMDIEPPSTEKGWLDTRLAFAWWAFHQDICDEIHHQAEVENLWPSEDDE